MKDIRHIHLDRCDSTQIRLKDEIQNNPMKAEDHILISTSFQENGRGRLGRSWDSYPNALAFSFTLSPHPTPTLTALEVAIHIVDFFCRDASTMLGVKWPNDILAQDGGKCGGILIDATPSTLIVGVGINLLPIPPQPHYHVKASSVWAHRDLPIDHPKRMPAQIVDHILSHRLDAATIRERWTNQCVHLDHLVQIQDGRQSIEGRFTGIGERGEALLAVDETVLPVYSGSLRF